MTTLVEQYYAFGLLVKSWATGFDYFSKAFPPNPPPTKPATAPIGKQGWALPPMNSLPVSIAGTTGGSAMVSAVAMTWDTFEKILQNAKKITPLGAITNLTHATNVVFVQGDNDTIVMRLPPQQYLQQSEQALLDGDPYIVPTFYDQYYIGSDGNPIAPSIPKSTDPDGPAAILKLQASRIGDYTMSNCNG
jgi:hypothetical protein